MKSILQFSVISLLLFSSCKKETVVSQSGKTTLTLNHTVGAESFALNKDFSIGGKTYHFTAFRYWISHVILTNNAGQQFSVPHSYYLVEQTNAQSVQGGSFIYPATDRRSIGLDGVPSGEYKSVTFSIGVDKEHNDNLSLQDGELEQMNNMTNVSWMWHTSYIFSTLEGTISDGTTPKDLLVQTGLNDNYVTVTLALSSHVVVGTADSEIKVGVDVSKVVDGIDVYATPEVSASTPAVMTAVANNYKAKVFSMQAAK